MMTTMQRVAFGVIFAIGCAAPAHSPPSSPSRCFLRIAAHGDTFVDGERRSRAEVVTSCKHRPGGAVVVLEPDVRRDWNPATRQLESIADTAHASAWAELRAELAREGVRIYIRGPLCSFPERLACRPQLPPQRPQQPTPAKILPAP